MVVSPSRLPFFLPQTVGPRSHLKMGPAAGRRTKARPKRLNGLFYLLDLILYASTGQVGAWADEKHDKNAENIQCGGFIDCRPVAHAPNLT